MEQNEYGEIIDALLTTEDELPLAVSRALFGNPIDNLGRDPEAIDPDNIQSATIEELFTQFTQRVEDGLRDDNRKAIKALYRIFGEQVVRILAQASESHIRRAKQATPKGLRGLISFVKTPEQKKHLEAARQLDKICQIIKAGRDNLRKALFDSFVTPNEDVPEKIISCQKVLPQLKFTVDNLERLLKEFSVKAFKVDSRSGVTCGNGEKPIIRNDLLRAITTQFENLEHLVRENPILGEAQIFQAPLQVILRDLREAHIFPFEINKLAINFETFKFRVEAIIQDLEGLLNSYKTTRMAELLRD